MIVNRFHLISLLGVSSIPFSYYLIKMGGEKLNPFDSIEYPICNKKN